jgi:hypothetical protein
MQRHLPQLRHGRFRHHARDLLQLPVQQRHGLFGQFRFARQQFLADVQRPALHHAHLGGRLLRRRIGGDGAHGQRAAAMNMNVA